MQSAIVISMTFVLYVAQARAADSPVQLCLNPSLTRQEQTLCRDQITGANTVAELRAAQKKFRDRIRAAEEAKKKK